MLPLYASTRAQNIGLSLRARTPYSNRTRSDISHFLQSKSSAGRQSPCQLYCPANARCLDWPTAVRAIISSRRRALPVSKRALPSTMAEPEIDEDLFADL